MKRFFLLCFLMMFWVTATTVIAEDESPWEKELPFKSVIVSYTISGMEEGQENLYIREYGKERATHHKTVTKMMGMAINNSTFELMTPDYIYNYDLQTNEGQKVTNPQKYMIDEYDTLSHADRKKVRENAEKTGTAFMEGMSGKIQQNAIELLGYSCDKVEIMGGAVAYLIHGTDIPLKTEVDIMGMKMDMEATSVEMGDVDDRFFQHPAGINAKLDAEADAMVRQMAIQVVAMLKDPENAPKLESQPMGGTDRMDGMSDEDNQMMQQAEEMMKGIKGMLGQ